MRRLPSFAPSLADRQRASQRGLDDLALLTGKPRVVLYEAKAKQIRKAAGSDGRPLEKDIQKTILAYLRVHPKISWVCRFNSGVAISDSGNGKQRYTRFNTMDGLSDIGGMLVGGRALWVEVKREGGKIHPNQQTFIEMVNAGGGLAFFATCIEDVRKYLG